MSMAGIGYVFVLFGLGALLMAAANLISDALPPRSQRLEALQKKRTEGEPLSTSEVLEAQVVDFDRKLPSAGLLCVVVGLVLVFIG